MKFNKKANQFINPSDKESNYSVINLLDEISTILSANNSELNNIFKSIKKIHY